MPASPRPSPRRAGATGQRKGGGGGQGSSSKGKGKGSSGGGGSGKGANDRRREPKTTAEKRAAEVKARKRLEHAAGIDRDQLRPAMTTTPATPDRWIPEKWQDEGPLRDIAEQAARRGRSQGPAEPRAIRRADPSRLEQGWIDEVKREADPKAAARYMERLTAATEAFERDRYRDALRMIQPVLKHLPKVGAAHEVAGLAHYRLGEWRKAAVELELARSLHPKPEQLPVLADCYRALRRYRDVEALWGEIKEISPAQEVIAEGRIVAAGALADQGKLQDAVTLMLRAGDAPRRVREHHLKQWYVIADLYDRSGDVINARNYFKRVAGIDADFADVGDRLATLGRR